MAVNYGYRRDRRKTATLMVPTRTLRRHLRQRGRPSNGTKLISEGVWPWGNPWGALQLTPPSS